MPAKYKGRYCFTERQAQEYNRTLGHLRNLYGDAFRELRKVGRSNLTHKRYRDAGVFFAKVAAQMIYALQILVEIRSSAQQPSCTRVEFVFSPVCGKCMTSPYGREDHPGVEAPPLDPAHYAELEYLLEIVNHTSERLWSPGTGRKTLPGSAFTTGLKRLADALVKQLVRLREMAPALPARLESRVYEGDDCSKCHGPRTIPAAERPAGGKE